MPVFQDPVLGGRYKWGRSNLLVTVENNLPLGKRLDRSRISVTMKIQRRFLNLLLSKSTLKGKDEWFDRALAEVLQAEGVGEEVTKNVRLPDQRAYYFCREIAFRLEDLAKNGPPHRKRSISLSILQGLNEARFVVSRDCLPLLKDFFSLPAPEGWTHISNLAMRLNVFFLGSNILERILKPARGKWARKQVLGDFLPGAYFACRELVLKAKDNTDLEGAIQVALAQLATNDQRAAKYLEDAKKLPDSYRDQIETLLLVYRAFYGSWERYGLDGLLEPQNTFRQYLYGIKRARLTESLQASRQHPDILQDTGEFWKEIYLGKIGAAAKAFRLI